MPDFLKVKIITCAVQQFDIVGKGAMLGGGEPQPEPVEIVFRIVDARSDTT